MDDIQLQLHNILVEKTVLNVIGNQLKDPWKIQRTGIKITAIS